MYLSCTSVLGSLTLSYYALPGNAQQEIDPGQMIWLDFVPWYREVGVTEKELSKTLLEIGEVLSAM